MSDLIPDPGSATASYQPDPQAAAQIADTAEKRDRWRQARQPHEQEWFVNAAMFRGNQYVEWSSKDQRLTVPRVPPHRVRLRINRLQSKIRARLSKFLKNRPKPFVCPATNEYGDFLNAKATQKVLDYLWRKLGLEHAYKEALLWAMVAAKGFWWYHWNPQGQARVATPDPQTGLTTYADQVLGDIEIEVGSPFEILVADPGCPHLGAQSEIMRVKMRKIEDLRTRYPEFAPFFAASRTEESLFTYERQIAGLTPYALSAVSPNEANDEVLVTEHFVRPGGSYPKGHYRVVVGDVLVKAEDELPYGFADLENPFPVTEFWDIHVPGQFWGTTVCAQLVDIQREYNLMRSKLAESLRLMAFPKLLVAKQHQVPKSAWTSEPGEIVEYAGIPNIPPPTPWHPPNVASDLWKAIELIKAEFDDVTQIFPASEGKVGTASSGFQTNLLQEATDSVHAPDIRQAELSIEEAALKLRRMVKLGYDVPRLISTVGMNYQPEVFEFSGSQVDEAADITVETGSALPTLKAARQEAVLNLYKAGIFGDPADPETRRQARSYLEMGNLEEAFDFTKTDERQAQLENKTLAEGRPIASPHFWENHAVHYNYHTNVLKSPESAHWSPDQKRTLVAHTILHARFINPASALQIATEENIPEVVPAILAMMPPPAPAPGPPGPESRPNVG